MMKVGVACDLNHFHSLGEKLESKKTDLRSSICSYIPQSDLDQFADADSDFNEDEHDLALNVDSAEQIADLLYKKLGVGLGMQLKRTKGGTRLSTGKKQLETLKRQHPIIPLILRYREYSKLINTFSSTLPKQAVLHKEGKHCFCGVRHFGDHHRIHGTINTTRTIPGRLSMRSPNLQQIPSRTKMGREVRKGFCAAPHCKLVARDFSQLHLRLLAWLGDEKVMQQIFAENGDIHVRTAMRAFKIDNPKLVDKASQRDPSKTAIFLTVYGGGALTLLDTLIVNFALAACECVGDSIYKDGKCIVCGGSMQKQTPDWLTLEWCDQLIKETYALYPGVPNYFAVQHYRASQYGITWCPFGRVRWVPEVHSCHARVVQAGLRQGGNHPIIGCEAGMVKVAQARVEDLVFSKWRRRGVHAEAVIPVHDELVAEVGEEWTEEVGEEMGQEMSRALEDVETGKSYSSVEIKVDGECTNRWVKKQEDDEVVDWRAVA